MQIETARGCSPRNTKSLEEEFQVEKGKERKNEKNTWFYMPRFYFEIENILPRILLNVCVSVREKK